MSVNHSNDLVENEAFDLSHTTNIIRAIVEDILNRNKFNEDNVNSWTRQIVDRCQQSLLEIHNSFKTIITAMIIPKSEENIHMSNACLWDYEVDGSTIIKWENNSMYCIVSAFALSSAR
ncbi:unnamed protein product [Rotaria socialis]